MSPPRRPCSWGPLDTGLNKAEPLLPWPVRLFLAGGRQRNLFRLEGKWKPAGGDFREQRWWWVWEKKSLSSTDSVRNLWRRKICGFSSPSPSKQGSKGIAGIFNFPSGRILDENFELPSSFNRSKEARNFPSRAHPFIFLRIWKVAEIECKERWIFSRLVENRMAAKHLQKHFKPLISLTRNITWRGYDLYCTYCK